MRLSATSAIAPGGTDKDRLTKIFNDLTEGGKVKGPLTEQTSGADVGWLTDKFKSFRGCDAGAVITSPP